MSQHGFRLREWGSAFVIATAIFIASNLGFLSVPTPLSGTYSRDVYIIRTVIDLGGAAVLYAHYLHCREIRVAHKLDAVRAVMKVQYQHYQMSNDAIDLINRKYHDLKHTITVLRAETNDNQRTACLEQMEAEIRTYETQCRTGNPVLDTILTGNSLACEKQGVSLTGMADGKLLDFMEVMGIRSLFGNALDNAIEYESTTADAEKHLIHVDVSAQNGLLLIQIENYCEDILQFQEGLPVSTKGGSNFHGYGLKSIRYVAEKYGGSLTVKLRMTGLFCGFCYRSPP